MKFSLTTEYAMRILGYMAKNGHKLYTSNELNHSLQIPLRYMRRLMTRLTKWGLIQSVQGKNGGYIISRPIREISLLDIINAVDEHQLSNTCFFGYGDCIMVEKCAMHDNWNNIRKNILEVLSGTSLQDLKDSGTKPIIQNFT